MSTGREATVRRLHVLVEGRVQGVGFRAHVLYEARALGLAGWVRNLDDGRVEVEAEGDEAGLRALLERCRRGPPAARVTRIEESWAAAEGAAPGFRVR